ncbi:alpha/beta fold hydrolase [Streptomyces mirabilis]|nr:alpha/beta fold hydrolase [Streptomyces mirabilis]
MSATVSFSLPSAHGPRTVTMSYARVGTGEPLLLLHGIGHHRQAWDPVVHILAAEREVIAVDLPGFGESPALPDGLRHDLGTVVPTLGGLCEALEIERPHVAGNSLGGLLALELGREKLVRSVTAISPAGFWSPVERRYAFGVLLAMRQGARRLPLPVIERLSRSAAGRAALTSTIYARPGRRSPEAVVAETSRWPRPRASPTPSGPAPPSSSRTTSRGCPSPWPGAPGTGCWYAARESGPSTSFPGPGWCGCRAAVTSR